MELKDLPVYVPTRDGLNPSVTMGKATLDDGKLVVEFDDKFPAEAIQRMLSRGENLGITFVMQKKKETNDDE